MSDISEKDISDIQPSSSLQMQQDQEQQTQHTPTQNKKENEAMDPAPTSTLTKENDEGVDEIPPSTKVVSDETRCGTRFHVSFQTKERGHENGPVSLSPREKEIC
ncbi:hypothetical protein P9112_002018 [Eukaryota sp. TZLM1-RC]